MVKYVELDDGNRWVISVEKGYCTNMISFSKGYIKDGEVIKSIDFAIWDDMSFRGYLNHNLLNGEEYPDNLEFEFNINDPIYFCLLDLLEDQDMFIIDDDDSYQRMKKYMSIIRETTSIKIVFTNTKNEIIHHNKYGAFIKNIGPDGRSKIEDIKIKYKIVDFLRNSAKRLLEEFPQMSIFEAIEIRRVKELENERLNIKRELKKY